MCGIFGHTLTGSFNVEDSRRALHTLTHRGPDQWGDWHDGKAYLGHRRLSILDRSEAGRQPMVSPDGTVVLTINGEIYNAPTLRAELEKHYPFTSHSDSEVVLHGYRRWGIKALVERLDGMFAFSLYDASAGKLYLVRDPIGIKPLYYSTFQNKISWASELKALVSYAGQSNLFLDYTALYDYLTYLYIPTPKSLYQGICKLPPAHIAEVDIASGILRLQRYWSLATETHAITPEAAQEKLRGLLAQAVKDQMAADVPVGFFLSGGMDSSMVVAEAAGLTGSNKLHSYTIGFHDKGRDESPYAAKIAQHFGTHHTQTYFTARDTQEQLGQLRLWYDEPFADLSAFPTHRVSALARETATVVLTGDGGDEIFGGYRWYERFLRYQPFQGMLSPAHPLLAYLKQKHHGRLLGKLATRAEYFSLSDPLECYAKLLGGMLKSEKQHQRQQWEIPADYDDYWHLRQWWRSDLPLRTRMHYLDMHTYLPDDILTKVDRASMAVSLEARVPLLSLPLVAFLFSVPENVRFPQGTFKGLAKQAYASVLPADILHRRKQGFSVPKANLPPLPRTVPTPMGVLQLLFPEVFA